MPGVNMLIEVIVFDKQADGGLAPVEPTMRLESEAEAITQAHDLARCHDGVVAIRRDVRSAIGETGPAEILYRAGHIGDFD